MENLETPSGRLRQRIEKAEQAKAAGTSSMRCPRCNEALAETRFEEV